MSFGHSVKAEPIAKVNGWKNAPNGIQMTITLCPTRHAGLIHGALQLWGFSLVIQVDHFIESRFSRVE